MTRRHQKARPKSKKTKQPDSFAPHLPKNQRRKDKVTTQMLKMKVF